ncbi:MAG: hypothetical protein ACK4RF_12525 [Cyclobacteriaceae bacterium]
MIKPYVLLALVVACSPSEKKQEVSNSKSLLHELQGEWEHLTKWPDGKWVVFRPCDADNLSIEVMGDTLVIGWGQDASFGIIRSFAESDVPGVYVITVTDQDEQTTKTYRMMWEDEAHNLAEWWLWDDDESVVMARAHVLGNYTAIEQPCQECWDDCEEDSNSLEEEPAAINND